MIKYIVNRLLYVSAVGLGLTMCAPAPVTPPAEANDVMQDYYTLMEFARRNVQYERKQKKLQTLDEDIYSAILEYYNGSNDTTVEEELLQLPSDGDKQSS